MFLLRRTAFRALSTPSTSLLSKPRSIVTAARAPLLSKQQWTIPSLQRRCASDDSAVAHGQAISEDLVVEPASAAEANIVAEVSAAPAAPTEKVESVTEEAFGSPASEQRAASSSGAAAVAAAAARSPGRRVGFGADKTPPSTTLYIGNLFFEVTEEQLQRQFERFGKIVKTRIVVDHRGLSKGFGYVEFENLDDAGAAIEGCDQETFQGRRMAVQYHRRRESSNTIGRPKIPSEPTKTLFIGNMSFEMSDKDLNDLFREVRNVIDVRVAIDRRTGQPRGFAHADFIDVESAVQARELLLGKEIYGRTLRVDFTQNTAQNRPQPSD